MTTEVDGGGALTAKVRYDIEEAFDYAFLRVHRRRRDLDVPADQRELHRRGPERDQRRHRHLRLQRWRLGRPHRDRPRRRHRRPVALRHRRGRGRVRLPGRQHHPGRHHHRRRRDRRGWTFDGFRATTGTEDQEFLNAYFVDNRQYVGRDKLLKHLYQFAGYAEASGLGRLLPERLGRPDQLLGHVVRRQQRRRAPRRRQILPGRRAPGVPAHPGRRAGAAAAADLRLGVLAEAERHAEAALRRASPGTSRARRRSRSSTTCATGGTTATSTPPASTPGTTSPAGTASTCRRRAPRSRS